jgi:hypothetical protein
VRFRTAGIVKAQKKEGVHWFDRNPGPANDTEVLTLSLLVCDSGASAADTDAWAKEVCLETRRAEQLGDRWTPPATEPWGGDLRKPGRNYLFVKQALEQPRTDDKLTRVAKAAHILNDVKGHTDLLDLGRLKDYLSQDRREAKAPGSKKKEGELRWKAGLLRIAQLVGKHRVRFQRALADGRERGSLQPTVELLAEERAAVQDLSKQLKKVKVARQTAEKRHASLKAANKKYKEARAKKLSGLVEKARSGYKTKVAAAKKAATVAVAERVKEALVRQGRTAEQIAAAAVKQEQLKTAKARKRPRGSESAARVSKQRLADKKKLADELAEIKEELDRHKEVLGGALAAKQRYTAIADKFNSMPSWELVRPPGTGRGARTLDPFHRVVIWELLTMGTPVAIIGKVIVAVLRRAAPWLNPVEPTPNLLRELRFELRTAEEAMAARRVAEAFRVRQLGLDKTTKFHVPSMVTSVLVEPAEGEPMEVIILRAAYGTGGETAALEAAGVEDKCFARLRQHYTGWKEKCARMFPKHTWSGPDPERCGLQRLGGGGCIINDTCSTACKTQTILIKMVGAQVKSKYDPAAWARLTASEQEAAVRCHAVHCWQHIRNIFLAPMSSAMSTLLVEKLGDDLDAFNSQERISTSMAELLRADYKEFHRGCRYYKGAGLDFWGWVGDTHPTAFLIPFERADGGRQDLDFDAAVPIYINRKYMVQFIEPRVFAKGHSNLLEDSIYVTHTKLEYLGMVRALAIVDLRIGRPLRWIAGNGPKMKEWSPFPMGPVLGKIEALLDRASRDGRVLLSPNALGIFEPLAAEHPAFREHLEWMYEKETILAADGKTPHFLYKEALAELLDPQDKDNIDTLEHTIDYLRATAAAGITKLHDDRTICPKYLSSQSGEFCWEKQAQGHADTIGCELSNDKFAESVFGTFDRMLKRNEGVSREGAAALTHAMRHKSFSSAGDNVVRRKAESERKNPLPTPTQGIGYFHRKLPHEEQLALVEYSRETVREFRKVDAADSKEHSNYVKAKVRTSSQEQLSALVTEFGYGLSFFQKWQQSGVTTASELNAELREIAKKFPNDERKVYQEKLDWLREQIEMRTRGLRWAEFGAQWGSSLDDETGTVEQLTGHLKEILVEERERRSAGEIPTEAPAPAMKCKTFKQLGTRTQQAAEFSGEMMDLSPAELRRLAELEQVRLEAAGEIDSTDDVQPKKAPGIDALVGVELELCWRYWERLPSGKRKQRMIWCQGSVVEVARSAETRLPANIRKELAESHAFRAVLVKWPADMEREEPESFAWNIIRPDDWREQKHLGWRYAPCELAKLRAKGLAAGKRPRCEE